VYDPAGGAQTSTAKLTAVLGGQVGTDIALQALATPQQSQTMKLYLQLQNGDFVALRDRLDSTHDALIAFNAAGEMHWIKPVARYYSTPLYALADGSMVYRENSQLVTLDAGGTETSRVTDLKDVQSWTATTYQAGGSGTPSIELPTITWGTGFALLAGGNPSSNQTYIPTIPGEWMPLFRLPSYVAGCVLGNDKVSLTSDALSKYQSEQHALLVGGYLGSSSCASFFASDPARSPYFSQLVEAVSIQVPYNGPLSTLSQYDAGMINAADREANALAARIKKTIPVCADFAPFRSSHGTIRPSGKTTASSQLTGPELHPADVYITTDSSALKLLDQGTILHEALHNRTGRYDDDLERLLGLDPSKDCPRGSICITEKLKAVGCAGPNQ
jgi:hypothetical protein